MSVGMIHRHLSNIDCLKARTACLLCFISTVNGRNKKKKPIKTGTSRGHITNLKQSILETFNIYDCNWTTLVPADLTPLNEDCNLLSELTSFSFWNTFLIELSKPCTLSLTNMHKNTEQRENKEVSRWMSHSKHRKTYRTYIFQLVHLAKAL